MDKRTAESVFSYFLVWTRAKIKLEHSTMPLNNYAKN